MKQIIISLVLLFLSLMFLQSCNKQDDNQLGINCPACTMAPDPGDCEAAIIRFYWDEAEQTCKEFTWGGCGDFPFETLEECQNCGCN